MIAEFVFLLFMYVRGILLSYQNIVQLLSMMPGTLSLCVLCQIRHSSHYWHWPSVSHSITIPSLLVSVRWPVELRLLLLPEDGTAVCEEDAAGAEDALVKEAAAAVVRLWSALVECLVKDDAVVAVEADRTILAFAIRGLSPPS